MSQSLSSRAMSFDRETSEVNWNQQVSIPFEQGDVFRPTTWLKRQSSRIVSIPFEQGDVFRQHLKRQTQRSLGLNPFRAGRCLSTSDFVITLPYGIVSIPFEQGDVFRLCSPFKTSKSRLVSIPFEQGDVFRLLAMVYLWRVGGSQSLSSRAMSFDIKI